MVNFLSKIIGLFHKPSPNIWFTADWHLFHKHIINYCNRPFKDVEEMHNTLIENYNKVVRPEDTVYFLGDMAFSNLNQSKAIIQSLKGHKILIRGNHDRNVAKCKELGFEYVVSRLCLYGIHGYTLILSHKPDCLGVILSREISLCGHVHTAWKVNNGHINVGVDVWNFAPVSIRQILDIRSKK
jgi:calcineurin-like phosphoesterase family protein